MLVMRLSMGSNDAVQFNRRQTLREGYAAITEALSLDGPARRSCFPWLELLISMGNQLCWKTSLLFEPRWRLATQTNRASKPAGQSE